jgi:plastocyanin
MPEERPDLFQQLWDFLSQLLFPNWPDLIALLPLVFIGLILLVVLYLAWMWRRSGPRNRSRVPTRLATGSPPPGVHMPGPSRWPFVAPIALVVIFFALILGSLPVMLAGLAIGVVAAVGWMRDAMGEWRTAEVGHAAAEWAPAHGSPRRLGAAAATAALPAGPQVAFEPRSWEIEPPPGVHMPGPSPWPFFAPIALVVILFGLILSPWLILGGIILGVIAAGGWLREANREWRSTERVGHAVPETRDPQRAWPRRAVPVFGTIIALSVGLALLPLGLAWLGSFAPGAATPTPLVVPERPEIAAFNSTSFDRRELVVPSGREFQLVFHNEESGTPHDVAITSGPPPADVVYFDGDVITGPETIEYQVPALEEGDFYFYCTIHPNMNGTVLARPETGAAPNGDGESPNGDGEAPDS